MSAGVAGPPATGLRVRLAAFAQAAVPSPVRRGGAAHRGPVAAMTVAAAALYVGFALAQQATFRTTTYDLVIFDQAVRSYAHFQPGIAIAKGIHNGGGTHFSILGDHWSPIIAALGPLYWLYDGPQTLLVVQGIAFAAAIPLIWMFGRRLVARSVPARVAAAVGYFAAGAYALSWPVAEATAFGFHEVAFVPVLTAAFFERMQAGRPRAALVAAAALLLVKEDMGLLVAGFGLWLLVTRRNLPRQRHLAAMMIAGGIAATLLATLVLRPVFGGNAMYYWRYGALGGNVTQAAWHLITHPLAAARLLIAPRVKLVTVAWLAGALLFLPLLSPISLAAVPLLAERMLASSAPDWWGLAYQYNAFVVVVVVCAAADGAMRLSRWMSARTRAARLPAIVTLLTGLCCATAVALVPVFPVGAALHPGFYRVTQRDRTASAAVAAVPPGVTVEAANAIGPQLTSRDTVLLWDWTPRWAPWVVADTGRQTFPFSGLRAQRQRVYLLIHDGYRVVLSRDGYVVLHRGTAGRRSGSSHSSAPAPPADGPPRARPQSGQTRRSVDAVAGGTRLNAGKPGPRQENAAKATARTSVTPAAVKRSGSQAGTGVSL